MWWANMTKTYFSPKCRYEIHGNRIVTDRTVMHKISGTSMAGILGLSPWSSPFQVACNLLGLAREDISEKPSVKVGNKLEPLIISYADQVYGPRYGTFLSAESVYEKRTGDHDSWVSDFDSDVFAGHVDGIVFSEDGNDYVLEIKTSSNLDSWRDGVPEYYYWQIALYNHFLCKREKAYVVLGMVNENTYRDHTSWVPNENTVAMFEMPINQMDVDEKIETVRKWYYEFVEKGITPEYDPSIPGDVEMYEHLVNLAQDVEEISKLVESYAEVDTAIAVEEAKSLSLYVQRDDLKARIKDYLTAHGLSTLDSTSGNYVGKVTNQTRVKFDEDLMIEDGIDVNKYKVKTVTKSFTVKKNTKKETAKRE
jgi:hypothetical protein